MTTTPAAPAAELNATALRALHEAATAGPWRHHEGMIQSKGKWSKGEDTHFDYTYPRILAHVVDDWDMTANAALIAYLRNAVPDILALIEERDRLREEVEALARSWSTPRSTALKPTS